MLLIIGICLTISLVVSGATIKPAIINPEDGTLIKGKVAKPIVPTVPIAISLTRFNPLDNGVGGAAGTIGSGSTTAGTSGASSPSTTGTAGSPFANLASTKFSNKTE